MRQTIAKRMLESRQNTATLTSFTEIDLSNLLAVRREHGPAFQERHGVKLGMMSFFVKACSSALTAHEIVGAMVRGTEIVYNHHHHIGVAVATPTGLMVPVVRHCEAKSVADLEVEIAGYADRARNKRLGLEDLQGGGFTVTNGGVFGSLLATPMLNPPQSASGCTRSRSARWWWTTRS